MHTLHRILVNIEKLETSDKDTIRDFAYIETHDFIILYLIRESRNAGGWSDEFPENILLGSENLERIIE